MNGSTTGLSRLHLLRLVRAAIFASAVASPVIVAASPEAQPNPVPVALPSVELPAELDRVLRDYETAWRARDAAGLAKLFTEDGCVLSNGKPPVRGRTAIAAVYAGSGGGLSLRAFEYGIEGSTGFIIGGYAPSAGAEDAGKFVLIVRRSKAGRWEILADIDNTNRRSGAQPALQGAAAPTP